MQEDDNDVLKRMGYFAPIEEYNMVFYADGRLVTLESKKLGGFPSALVAIQPKDNGRFGCTYFNLCLGIRKGKDYFEAIR